MIIGYFHTGSGLGNQLHRLVATRVRAADLGVDWGMMYNHDNSGKEKGFKGESFMDIGQWDKGIKKIVHHFNPGNIVIPGQNLPTEPEAEYGNWTEKCVRDEFGNDIRSFDPEFNFIEDNTIIEGEFQSEIYWEHREKEVNEWLKVEPLDMPSDVCVLAFRGGEFAVYPDLFLTKEYWKEAIDIMLKTRPGMKFEVHTDDVELARKFFIDVFPDWRMCLEYIHDIGTNWRSLRYAKYAITSNSSFAILPRWLKQGEDKDAVTISPRYWGRRNTKVWSLPQNFYKRFKHI